MQRKKANKQVEINPRDAIIIFRHTGEKELYAPDVEEMEENSPAMQNIGMVMALFQDPLIKRLAMDTWEEMNAHKNPNFSVPKLGVVH